MADRNRKRREARRYIENETLVRVRFHEVDSIRIVWHGHYLTYFEDGRRAFGREHGMDYPVFLDHGVLAPLAKVNVDYLSPARQNDVLRVRTRLLESEGAKIEFAYEIRREGESAPLARGTTLQVFTTMQGELILTPPEFLLRLREEWEPLWKNGG